MSHVTVHTANGIQRVDRDVYNTYLEYREVSPILGDHIMTRRNGVIIMREGLINWVGKVIASNSYELKRVAYNAIQDKAIWVHEFKGDNNEG